MKYFKELDLKQYDNLLDRFNELNLPLKSNQICLNSIIGKEEDYYLGCGSLYYDWSTVKRDDKGNILSIENFKSPLKESDFTKLCPIFWDTELADLYNMLNKRYKLGRVRIMRLPPGKVMTWHEDDSSRLHLPLKTQEGCMMVIEDEVLHLKENQWYWTDTTKKHTAFNASPKNRYHIVAAII